MIRRIGVVGAGLMGSGIAAQAANAGAEVVLLDLVPGGAAAAVARMLKAVPSPFMHPGFACRVTAGDLGTELGLLGDCDWIIEAIVERVEAKRELYAALETVRKPGSAVSSNTSTIPLAALVDGLPARFAEDFLITHFFNPPRHMRLLEMVTGPATRPEAVQAVERFADIGMGKSVITCQDTPGFIANRIGTLWLQAGLRHAIDLGLTIEEADAVAGRPMGVPRTGIFGLLDLVGLDLMPLLARSLLATLPADDAYRSVYRDEPLVARMIAEGRIGRKAQGGFTRIERAGKARQRLSIDLATGEYRPEMPADLASLRACGLDLRRLAEHPDRGGRYARALLLDVLPYAASLVPEIADRIEDVDAAMRLGYNWEMGPFELIDRLGPAWLADTLAQEGRVVPALLDMLGERPCYRMRDGTTQAFGPEGAYHTVVRPQGVLLLADLRQAATPLRHNASARLWDIGDGVACLEFTSKMNTLDPAIMALIHETVALGQAGGFQALVLYNEGPNFSVGANLKLVHEAATRGAWNEIATFIESGQIAFSALRNAGFPVVGAPAGLALGGGCEILLHCDAVQAHAESFLGLVEVGVGLVPGWGGCATLLARFAADPATAKGPMPAVLGAFDVIANARVSTSAATARDVKLLRPTDGITLNRDRLLADAKARALALVPGYAPAAAVSLRLPGAAGRAALALMVDGAQALGQATPHDRVVCDGLAEVLSGGAADLTEETGEAALLALERQVLLRLVRDPATQRRIAHMLETGKPLRN
jgi:3-hydroxyacyl-CoA dehydrogenase